MSYVVSSFLYLPILIQCCPLRVREPVLITECPRSSAACGEVCSYARVRYAARRFVGVIAACRRRLRQCCAVRPSSFRVE